MKRSEALLLSGILATNFGNASHILLVGKYLFDLTGSAKSFGLALAFEQVMALCATLLAGPLVDRWNPYRTLVITEILRGLLVSSVGLIVLTNPSALWIYAMILAIQLGRPFYKS